MPHVDNDTQLKRFLPLEELESGAKCVYPYIAWCGSSRKKHLALRDRVRRVCLAPLIPQLHHTACAFAAFNLVGLLHGAAHSQLCWCYGGHTRVFRDLAGHVTLCTAHYGASGLLYIGTHCNSG